jgi:hypothetical protein
MKHKNGSKEFRRFVKFGLFSVSAGLVETGLFYVLGLIPSFGYWALLPARLIASVVWNLPGTVSSPFIRRPISPRRCSKTFALLRRIHPDVHHLGRLARGGALRGVPRRRRHRFFWHACVKLRDEFLYQRYYVYRGKVDNAVKDKTGRGNSFSDSGLRETERDDFCE